MCLCIFHVFIFCGVKQFSLNHTGYKLFEDKDSIFGPPRWHQWYRICLPRQETQEMVSSIPGSRRSLGLGNGNPLQCSCLGNFMGRGAWQAMVHGGHKESDMTEHTHTHTHTLYFCCFMFLFPTPKIKPCYCWQIKTTRYLPTPLFSMT